MGVAVAAVAGAGGENDGRVDVGRDVVAFERCERAGLPFCDAGWGWGGGRGWLRECAGEGKVWDRWEIEAGGAAAGRVAVVCVQWRGDVGHVEGGGVAVVLRFESKALRFEGGDDGVAGLLGDEDIVAVVGRDEVD